MSPGCCFSTGLDDHGFLTSPSARAAGCWYELAAPGHCWDTVALAGYFTLGTEQLSRTWLNSISLVSSGSNSTCMFGYFL